MEPEKQRGGGKEEESIGCVCVCMYDICMYVYMWNTRGFV